MYLRGRIRPWSVTYCLSRFTFLGSSASIVKSTFGRGRGVRRSVVVRRPRELWSVLVLRGMLFDFAVYGVASQKRVVFFLLNAIGLNLLVARCHVP